MSDKVQVSVGNASGGIGLASALGIVFVVLKLCGVIGWSWWWVLVPWWIALGLTLVVLAILAVIFLVVWIIEEFF